MTITKPRDIGEFVKAFEQGTCERIALQETLRTAIFSNNPELKKQAELQLSNTQIGTYKVINWYITDSKINIDLQNGTSELNHVTVYQLPIQDHKLKSGMDID